MGLLTALFSFTLSLAWAAFWAVALFVGLIYITRALFFSKRTEPNKCSIAFFHPFWLVYYNVLWAFVSAVRWESFEQSSIRQNAIAAIRAAAAKGFFGVPYNP